VPRVHIGIGSNVDREKSIRGAIRELAAHYGPLNLSLVYESKAHGFEGDNFFNLVASFDTTEPIERIKETLSHIESRFGRTRRKTRFSARTLDLDLLLYDDIVRHDSRVNLPHPDIQRYAFVLRPLADVAPDLRHPETKMTYTEMWNQFKNKNQEIRAVKFEFED
jgi:2-amino-4-hydroxy-6-hydroxymethyldihydropteridine diphosphokinase